MKKLIGILALLPLTVSATTSEVFTVKAVGASNNTNTVFVITEENATNQNCNEKNIFRLPLDNQLNNMYFSAALTAKTSGQKLGIAYGEECVKGGILVEYFQLKD